MPYIQPTVAFLCKQVRGPDQDDKKKLIRVMRYLNETKCLSLTLEADGGINVIKWLVDALYGVHPGMKIYTGAIMTLGK